MTERSAGQSGRPGSGEGAGGGRGTGRPSVTELVHEVLRSAEQPLTFQQILQQVTARGPAPVRDPRATVRNALSQGRQLVSLGDGRYGYLPHLVRGSLLRLPLAEKKPAHHPLRYPDDLRHALWPSFLDSQKRRQDRPARLRLPSGQEVALRLEFQGAGAWGCAMPEPLRQHLVEKRAAAGDALLVRVEDGEAGTGQVWLESHQRRDEAAVARRAGELADAAASILRGRSESLPIWDLVILLLGRGAYRADVAPPPLADVLSTDPRFVDAGFEAWILAEKVRPQMRAAIRDRQQRSVVLLDLLGGPRLPDSAAEPVEPDLGPALLSPEALRARAERGLAEITALLAEREPASIDEANALLQELLVGGQLPGRVAHTPLERAQELIYDARESPSPRERIKLARRALELSQDCADAYVLLAEETARGPTEALVLYTQGVAAGERALGPEAFEEDTGHFWGILETRPYMRARMGLAHALWALGERAQATAHLWDMLRLNPGDYQGARYVLLTWLLEMRDDAEVARLLTLYPDDGAAAWLYGAALHTVRVEGDSQRARKLRAEATRQNPHVPAYLVGRKRLPAHLPDTIGFGDEREAVVCAAEQQAAWRATPGALAWLEQAAR